MGNRRFTNNPSSLLSASILSGDTSATVTGGTGSLFPSLSGAQYAIATLEDIAGNIEVVHITARAGDVFTLLRGQEGTLPRAYASGSRIELRLTRGALESFIQKDGDDITGTLTMTGVGRLQGGSWRDGTELVNTPIRGATGITTNELVVRASGTGATLGGSELLTAGNIAANTPAGYGLTRTNMVIGWVGSLITIPAGYLLCDGTNGTPDLRGRMLIGAGGTYALGQTGGLENSTTSAGGAVTPTIQGTVLSVANLPAHNHRLYVAATTSSNTASLALTNTGVSGDVGNLSYRDTQGNGTKLVEDTGSGTAHTHVADALPTHTHTVATLPPYYGLFFIMKT